MSETQQPPPVKPIIEMACLHNHSETSRLDGHSSVENIAKTAKKMGYKAVALTDHGTCGGLYKFQQACLKEGVKPILGSEMYFVDDVNKRDSEENRRHITIWAKNKAGYHNLIKLSTLSYQHQYYKPRIDFDMLCSAYGENLIIGSACVVGIVAGHLHDKDDLDGAKAALLKFRDRFKDDFVVEIMSHKFHQQEKATEARFRKIFKQVYDLATEASVRTILTGDSHYSLKEDAPAHDVLLSIQTNDCIGNPGRFSFHSDDFFIHPADEYVKIPQSHVGLVKNTVWISDRVEDGKQIQPFTDMLPDYNLPPGETSKEGYLKSLIRNGMAYRGLTGKPEYEKRIEEELDVIVNQGFVKYFLILFDIVSFARNKGVRLGCGRGSGVASLCLYCMRITGIDPVKYDLLFARFLSKDRVSPPDLDLDFSANRRKEIHKYIIDRWGADCVAKIGTVGSLGCKDAIKRVGKALDIGGDYLKSHPAKGGWESGPKTLALVDEISKSIQAIPGITIDDALKTSMEEARKGRKPVGPKYLFEYEKEFPKVFELARKLCDLTIIEKNQIFHLESAQLNMPIMPGFFLFLLHLLVKS